MGSRSTQPTAAATKMILAPVMTLEGHNDITWSMAYLPDGNRIISVSFDKTIRQWDLQAGKAIEEVRDVYEGNLYKAVVSRDGRWVMTAGRDEEYRDLELKAYEIETGIVKTFQDSRIIRCIDISADGKLLASGSEFHRTVLIWGMDTGKLVAGPFESDDYVGAIRFSPDSKKLAVKSQVGRCLEVWDVQTQKLDAQVGEKDYGAATNLVPIFWTKKGTILAAFDLDVNHSKPTTIYEFDASTLETVGDPLEGHTDLIHQLALSSDGTLLASSSFDNTIKLWSLEPRQLLASFIVQHESWIYVLIFSPDTRQLAYSADHKIFICTIPPDILTSIRVAPDAQAIVRICCIYLLVNVLISSSRSMRLIIQPSMTYSMCTPHCSIHLHYSNTLSSLQPDATRRPVNVLRNPASSPMISLPPRPLRPMHTRGLQQLVFLRHLRNLLSFSYNLNAVPPVQNCQPRDPLDVCLYLVSSTFDLTISPQIPATSSRIHGHTPVARTTQGDLHSDPRVHVTDQILELHFLTHIFFSLDAQRHYQELSHLSPLQQHWEPTYNTYRVGGLLIQVINSCLSSTSLLRRANWYAPFIISLSCNLIPPLAASCCSRCSQH